MVADGEWVGRRGDFQRAQVSFGERAHTPNLTVRTVAHVCKYTKIQRIVLFK
jgi:hypothetical protein